MPGVLLPAIPKQLKGSHPLVLPSVRKGHGWKRDTPKNNKDRRLRMKLGDAINEVVPENPTLDPQFYPRIRDQGNLGSCTGFGMRSCLLYKLLQRNFEKWQSYDISPLYSYFISRMIENSIPYDTGAEIRDVIMGASKYGVSREDFWPYDIAKFARTPPKRAQNNATLHQAVHYYRCDEVGMSGEATVDNILRALAADLPVTYGFACFDNLWEANNTGVVPLPTPRSRLEGGHCVDIYEADTDARVFIGPNSWGPWGHTHAVTREAGYIIMPFSMFTDGHAVDAWAVDHE